VNLQIHVDGSHDTIRIAFLLHFAGLECPAELADGLTIPGEI
jgi:hypothetical protein